MTYQRHQYRFGKRSSATLPEVHPDLQRVLSRALSYGVTDFSIICGARTEAEQAELVRSGMSQTMKSKHLTQPDGYSHAVDILPYPAHVNGVNVWQDKQRFCVLAGLMLAAASEEGVSLRWGGDWDSDGNNADSSFLDLPHFELN